VFKRETKSAYKNHQLKPFWEARDRGALAKSSRLGRRHHSESGAWGGSSILEGRELQHSEGVSNNAVEREGFSDRRTRRSSRGGHENCEKKRRSLCLGEVRTQSHKKFFSRGNDMARGEEKITPKKKLIKGNFEERDAPLVRAEF